MSFSRDADDFRTLFEATPGLYLVLRSDLTIAAVTDGYLRATMTTRCEIIGQHIFDVFPDNPNDQSATGVSNLRASLERVIAGRRADAMAVQKYDVRKPESDGGAFEERYWSPLNAPVLDERGQLRYIIHRVEDVTEFIRLQADSRTNQQLTANRTGQMEAEIVRRGQELQDANRQLRRLHAELEARVKARTAELQESNLQLQHEIEERRQAEQALHQSEEQLRQAQKLEAVGRLAGGVAHDFNNLLSVVLSYCELALEEVEADSAAALPLREIQRAGQRAADLTRQLLAFSRHQVLDLTVIDLNNVLGGLGRLLARVLGEDIELKILTIPALATVRADKGQLDQVILNLVVNARDAMPHGGKLTVACSVVDLDEEYAREHVGVTPGPYVMVSVSDTGVGMSKATQARAFEPFFTTKAQGKGTGLGLSTVFGIVKQSGGHIWLYSEPDMGTTFKIYLPRVAEAVAPSRDVSQLPVVGGHETILLVEDEEQVRNVAMTILKQLGYRVLEASTPEQALSLCVDHKDKIDLLLTDVVMPRLSGREVADRVSILRPDLAVLFMSGYTDDAMLQHGVLDEGMAFVQKPLTPAVLARKVREVLDRRAGQ